VNITTSIIVITLIASADTLEKLEALLPWNMKKAAK